MSEPKVLSQGYIIELAEGGPWLKNDLTWTDDWSERGVWHDIFEAELAIADSLNDQTHTGAKREGG